MLAIDKQTPQNITGSMYPKEPSPIDNTLKNRFTGGTRG